MALVDDLLDRAKDVAAARGLTLGQLGRQVVDNHKFFRRLMDGGDVTTRTAEQVLADLDAFAAGRPLPSAGRKGAAAASGPPVDGSPRGSAAA